MSEAPAPTPEEVTRELIDRGVLIHSAWRSYRRLALGHVAKDSVVAKRCQESFEAGAAFMFDVMVRFGEDCDEVSQTDRRRMEAVNAEVHAIDVVLRHKYGRTKV